MRSTAGEGLAGKSENNLRFKIQCKAMTRDLESRLNELSRGSHFRKGTVYRKLIEAVVFEETVRIRRTNTLVLRNTPRYLEVHSQAVRNVTGSENATHLTQEIVDKLRGWTVEQIFKLRRVGPVRAEQYFRALHEHVNEEALAEAISRAGQKKGGITEGEEAVSLFDSYRISLLEDRPGGKGGDEHK